jgi:hypothetical protein
MSAVAETTERQRVQIEFSPDAFDKLREIKNMADHKSYADVVRKSLQVYDWFLRQQRDSWKIQLVKGDTVKEVELIL